MQKLSLLETIDGTIEAKETELVELRRHLHTHPELSHQEYETTKEMARRLRDLGFEVTLRPEGVGLYADLTPDGFDPQTHLTVAVRSDLDALPIHEQTGLDFASTEQGVMHACGHDMHMTCVMGVAIGLSAVKAQLEGRVRILYQHSEEVAPGGAEDLVALGAMEGVDAVLGLHCDPTIAVGEVGVRVGAFTASSDAFTITIKGQGGHSARPHQAVDPVFIGVQVANNLYQLAGRVFDARDAVVIAIGSISGGQQHNVIPDDVTIKGTARSLSVVHRREIKPWLDRVVGGICAAYGASHEMKINRGAPAIVNDEALTEVVRSCAQQVLGADSVHGIKLPSMGAEDFSYYLEHAPGSMFRLGVARAGRPIHMLHSPHFDPDESAIAIGARIVCRAVIELQKKGR